MFVRSLRLAGFKSFADPTVLVFESGVNVIVGPNGSGKSNIADALSWVLGSQAPSSLRGGTMEDVIFAGSEARPRLSLAEIELTLDNSTGALPLDLSEVTISRSADRTGVSEYRINGAPCRLLDIQELLSDAGVGRSLHAVVGQGQLDEVLQARPEERRTFIEEAAQIGKYRKRKERALRKIERVDDNLVRVNDVLSELRRSIRPLKRQATAAAQHSELRTEYVALKQRLAATEVQRLALAEAELDLDGVAQRGALLADELASTRARLTSASDERERLASDSEAAQSVAHRIARTADRLGALARLAEERAARVAARLAAETEEGHRERIRLMAADRDRWARERDALRPETEDAGRRRDRARVALADAEAALDDAERALAAARAHETDVAQKLVRAEGSAAAGKATIGSIEARVDAVLERRALAEHALGREDGAIATAEDEVRALERDLDAATEAAAAAEARLEEERMRADSLRGRLHATYADRAAASARVETLEDVLRLFSDRVDVADRLRPLVVDAGDRERVVRAQEDDARGMVRDAEVAIESRWQEVARLDEELRRLDALSSGAADRLSGLRRRRENHEIEIAALNEELARVRESLAATERAAAEEQAALPAIRAAADEARFRREEAERGVTTARAAAERARDDAQHAEIDARGAEERALGMQLRVEEAEAALADAHGALADLADIRAGLERARVHTEEVGAAASLAAERARRWSSEADDRAARVRERARSADAQLHDMRARERELEASLETANRRRNEVEVKRAETRARIDALGERAMDEWGLSPTELLEAEALGDTDEPEARARMEALERQIKRLGPVNPTAAEEYAEISEREEFLVTQMEDLKSSRRDLLRIVREVDDTIVAVFGTAFEDVAREYEVVIARLFPGGSGRLKLTDPADLLGSGIEIEARPPGKNVRKLSLLSGGERSLVALAFLFAIFRARPSPFYLLDEVEAALDDINLQRFLRLVDELQERAQVLVVTHQKRTMDAADVLYGVSMARDGVSRVVAKKMEAVDLASASHRPV